MAKLFAILIICLITVGFVVISGCTSAKDDIAKSKSLMDSGMNKNNNINVNGDQTNSDLAIDKMDSAKSDYQQALDILNAAKTDSDDEKQLIAQYKTICEASIQYLDARKSFVNALNHYDKMTSYLSANDYTSAKNELTQTKKYTKNAIAGYNKAKATFSAIPCPLTPTIDYRIKGLNTYSTLLDGVNYLILGSENVADAQSISSSNTATAKNYLIEAKSNFQNAKDIFDNLKTSDDSASSTGAIKLSDLCKNMNDRIDIALALLK